MTFDRDNDNMLSVLDRYTFANPDDIALQIAKDFKQWCIERHRCLGLCASHYQGALRTFTR